ncbi:hypothetical protein EVAR_44946_1 [Eumeta japonica]|uniref:Uncharacterized protein n=1 Tax=Eumeta variegata TaxID=151549 RepID=A0A4C1W340_EUMVA|nr:hypothetical protein EVAR_44946_1 [Eumeta japonica]
MLRRKKVFTKPQVDSKRRKVVCRTGTEEQQEKRFFNIRKGVKRIRENLTEEERTHTGEEVLSRMRTLRNCQSADRREVENRRSKERMAILRKKRAVTSKIENLKLQAFH